MLVTPLNRSKVLRLNDHRGTISSRVWCLKTKMLCHGKSNPQSSISSHDRRVLNQRVSVLNFQERVFHSLCWTTVSSIILWSMIIMVSKFHDGKLRGKKNFDSNHDWNDLRSDSNHKNKVSRIESFGLLCKHVSRALNTWKHHFRLLQQHWYRKIFPPNGGRSIKYRL